MSFEVIFDSVAVDFLNSLEKPIKERIYKKIMSTVDNPMHFFERLEGRKDYKLRIGDYRAIADISFDKKRIEITLIGHRKNVYQQLP
jgi:mRNA interferase RelE/StbE